MFIVIEGMDGSGKSDQSMMLSNNLVKSGYSVYITKEPGGTIAGKAIKDIILDPGIDLTREAELLLFLADRVQHVKSIKQHMKDSIVICDRYEASTYAYDLAGNNTNSDLVNILNIMHDSGAVIYPDLCIILDVPVEVSFSRIAARNLKHGITTMNKIEARGSEYFERVRAGYLDYALKTPNTVVINANRSKEEVYNDICEVFGEYKWKGI
jgi:dTMP kinase